MKTNPNPKTKPPSKGEMVATIQRAIAKMEHPFDVKLTSKCVRDLMRQENYAYLQQAFIWAQYILTWQYGRMSSDDIRSDYAELTGILSRMYTDKMWEWRIKE